MSTGKGSATNPKAARKPNAGAGNAARFGKVAVLFGGTSNEREISIMSGTGVLKALQSKGVDAHAFDPAARDLAALKHEGYARCFIALHGRGGEDGTIQGALQVLEFPTPGRA